MDRDESSVGGIKNPMMPTQQLYYVTLVMDSVALLLASFITPIFLLGILLYILASRAYSSRNIRLKKYPITGFFTVFVFQGALVFFICYQALQPGNSLQVTWLPCLISSLLIGALYPLTQIYQHKEDKADGVITISYLLGKKGSFIFSAFFFLAATLLMYILLKEQNNLTFFYYFLILLFPVVLFFLYWMSKVWRNEAAADYKNSLVMNVLATFFTTSYFLLLTIHNH